MDHFRLTSTDSQISGNLSISDEGVAGSKVFLANEEGDFIDEAITDSFGNFEFKRLPPDGKFSFVLDNADTDAQIVIFIENDEGEVYQEISSRTTETLFIYKNLESQQVEHFQLYENDAILVGQLSDIKGNLKGHHVVLVDENGVVIDVASTDSTGSFEFKRLPSGRNFAFILDENDAGAQLNIAMLDDNGQINSQIDSKNNRALFTYDKSARDMVAKHEHRSNELPMTLIDIGDRNGQQKRKKSKISHITKSSHKTNTLRQNAISGRILTLNGLPVSGTNVYLFESDSEKLCVETDSCGVFYFANTYFTFDHTFVTNLCPDLIKINVLIVNNSGKVLYELDNERHWQYFRYIEEDSKLGIKSTNETSIVSKIGNTIYGINQSTFVLLLLSLIILPLLIYILYNHRKSKKLNPTH